MSKRTTCPACGYSQWYNITYWRKRFWRRAAQLRCECAACDYVHCVEPGTVVCSDTIGSIHAHGHEFVLTEV